MSLHCLEFNIIQVAEFIEAFSTVICHSWKLEINLNQNIRKS